MKESKGLTKYCSVIIMNIALFGYVFLTWGQAHPHFSKQNLQTSHSENCSDAVHDTAAGVKFPSGCCRLSVAPFRWCSHYRGCTLCLRSLFKEKVDLTSEIWTVSVFKEQAFFFSFFVEPSEKVVHFSILKKK